MSAARKLARADAPRVLPSGREVVTDFAAGVGSGLLLMAGAAVFWWAWRRSA